MDAHASSTPVLVVGAGPVGAVLALELAHHNVASVVVERSVAPSSQPKMDYLSGRSMELLRRIGLAPVLREHGVDPDCATELHWTNHPDEPPVHVWHHPSVNQLRRTYAGVNDGSVPAEPYQRISGALLEQLAREAARRHPLIDLREGWTFSDLRLVADGVRATVLAPGTGARHAIEARYLAACDGAESTVRRCLEIGMDEADAGTAHCSVYFRSTDPVLRRHGRAFVTFAAGGLTLISRDEHDTWTGNVPIVSDEWLAADPVELLRRALGLPLAVQEVQGVAQWHGPLGVARSYRRGAAFLVGDSAYQLYPPGGYCADTCLADAVDLGWKLAGVVTGWAGPALLDSYEAERRPVAMLHRELSAGLLQTWHRFGRLAAAGAAREVLVGILEQEVYQIDNLGVHFGCRYEQSPVIWHEPGRPPQWHWQRITPTTWPGGRAPAIRLADGEQLFDRLGPGFTLVDLSGCGLGEPLAKEAQRRGVPMAHLPLDDAAVRTCWERDLVLVRPDHHVAWRGDDAPPDWTAVLDRVCGRKTP